jgi:hypothetical protein
MVCFPTIFLLLTKAGNPQHRQAQLIQRVQNTDKRRLIRQWAFQNHSLFTSGYNPHPPYPVYPAVRHHATDFDAINGCSIHYGFLNLASSI